MASAPTRLNLRIYQGSTFYHQIVWKVGPTTESTVPVDLTGCTARAMARPDIQSKKVLFELTTENGGITLGGDTGAITLFLSEVDTAALKINSGVWDLEIVFANGDVRRLFEGKVSISKEVTRG